jgi:hypothetical protein
MCHLRISQSSSFQVPEITNRNLEGATIYEEGQILASLSFKFRSFVWF